MVCHDPLCNCDGTPSPTPQFDSEGRQIFENPYGYGFRLVVEGKKGTSQVAVGTTLQPPPTPVPPGQLTTRPDLQIEGSQPMGIFTSLCDPYGGIQGISPPDFGPSVDVTNALWNFSCRFQAFNTTDTCLLDAYGNPNALANPSGAPTVQFCDVVTVTKAFPPGDSILTVQLRDTSQNLGPTAQAVIRVPTLTPTQTPP
jgi:hypothetical protein